MADVKTPPEDHPRVCGEKFSLSRNCKGDSGSSPRVRGEDDGDLGCQADDGIIPACAGRRKSASNFAALPWDHPRVCGEKEELVIPWENYGGSSPRVRGEDPLRPKSFPRSRIIPACAGRSSRTGLSGVSGRDHPRVCGEKRPPRPLAGKRKGSSPRVRGEV